MKIQWNQRLFSVVLMIALLMQLFPLQVLAQKTEMATVPLPAETVTELEQAFTESEQLPVKVLNEVKNLRTETEKHFRMSDGSYMAVSYGIPVHYQDENGAWLDIDNTMSLTSDEKGYRLSNEKMGATFAANLNSGSLLTASYGGTSVSISLLDTTQADLMISENQTMVTKLDSKPSAELTYNRYANADIDVKTESVLNMKVSGKGWTADDVTPQKLQSSVLYEDVFSDVDLLYTAYGYNIKEQIIVNAPQSSYRYNYLLDLNGVEAVLNGDGSVSLINEDNEEIYFIPAPFMEDSNGIISHDVVYSLAYTEDNAILTVEADAAWMNDEARVYPVAIDPTINVQAGSVKDDIYTSYVAEGAPDTSYGAYQNFYLGYTTWNNLREYRGFAHFSKLPSIPDGAIVTDAMFGLYMHDYSYVNRTEMSVGIYEVTEDKPDATSTYSSWIYNLTWNSMPDYDITNMIDYTILSNDAQDQYYYWDISELVKKWYAEETENRTIAMAMVNNSCSNTNYAQPVFYSWANNNPPVLLVSYQNILGIEDYYSYATLDAGAAGTAYICDYSGQLTAVKELVSYTSDINPFSVSLVYNSNYRANSDWVSDYPSEEFMQARIGQGWTLDVLQMLSFEIIDGEYILRYRDGDGTLHYFVHDTEENIFYDEDGLGLSVKRGSIASTYIMTDSQDNTYTFSYNTLSSIKDNNGNQYIFYSAYGKLTRIAQKNNSATDEITVVAFDYTDNYLTTVTDAAGRVYTLNYTGDLLTSISLGDTVIAEYVYNGGTQLVGMTDGESGYTIKMAYENQNGKVIEYVETDGIAAASNRGVEVFITYDEAHKTTYTNCGNDRVKNTSDDIITHYLFDHSGRTVNACTTDANGNILGADTATYFDGSLADKRNNRTTRTASIGVAAEQEILNGGFENTSNNTWSGTVSTTNPRTGAHSLKLTATSGDDVYASKESRTLYAGATYTLSGYVNTTEITTILSGGIYLMVQDTNGNAWLSNFLSYQTSEDVDNGWVQIAVTFTAKTTCAHTISVGCYGVTGTFYADDLQLERGNAPSNVNLVENGNFQEGSTGWTLGLGSFPTISYGMYREYETTKAMTIGSSPTMGEAKFYQNIPLGLGGKVTYVLSGWAMGNAVPDNLDFAEDLAQDTVKTFGLRAIVNYSDNTKECFYTAFNPEVSDWQFTSLAVVPSQVQKTVASITIECVYEKNANMVRFDNISLVRETVQTMSYDDDGNLTSVSTSGVIADTSRYEDGNLIETVTGAGGSYTYTYDDTYSHRLLSSTNGTATQTMTYDNYGNVTSSTTRAGEGPSLVTSDSYSPNGNLILSSRDANNKLTSYQYNTAVTQMLGLPTLITDANNTSTSVIYDEFGRTTQTNIANQANLCYNYENGNLKSIVRQDNSGNTLNYNMYYDKFGNMTAFAVNATPIITYEYGNRNGQLIKQTYSNSSENSIYYTYDNLGRMATTIYPDGRIVTYTYTGDGQLYSVQEIGGDSPATYQYAYDSLGRLIASEKKDEAGNSLLRVYQRYDDFGQLIGQIWCVGNNSYSESYTYTTDDLLSAMVTGTGETLQFGYDDLQRLTSVGNGQYTKNYSYHNLSETRTTMQVSQVQYNGLPTALAYGYTYDALGNIATYSAPGKGMVTYTYDAQGQLLSAVGDETYTYTYDSAGNILTANGHTYTYGARGWPDVLTAFDGERIAFDLLANPISYYNGTRWTFTWENGRNLATATDGTTNISYAYDADGLRTSKTVGGTVHYYTYTSGQLLREAYNGNTLDFFYDASGYPYALKYNSTTYYYITNLQGDVMYLVDAEGNTVASYEYDPYGNIISATGTMSDINPLRYRGYYYDSELEMYYLQSRYYDPAIGRFINADIYASTGQGVIGYNMFAYCINAPVNRVDTSGEISSVSYFKRDIHDAYHVTTTIRDGRKSVTCSYLIKQDGRIRFYFSENPYQQVVRYKFEKTLASTMLRLARKLNGNFLKGRTESGIYRELKWHYGVYLTKIPILRDHANPADIGALSKGLGYDSNAFLFEYLLL